MGKRGVFEPVTLGWDGADYVIPADRIMGAIARVENVVTIKELHDTSRERGTVKLATLAQAFGALLRYAGADVTDDEVYAGMFAGDVGTAAQTALVTLVSIMIPPATANAALAAASEEQPRKKTAPVAAASSRKRTS